MNKEYKIKLDLNKKLYNKKMAFNQFDENVNDFYIEITKNNEVVKDLDKSIITLVAIKPDNTVDAQFIEVTEGQIYADLKPSMCDLVGNYQAKAMIVLGGEIVTTDTINYSVNEDKIISRLNEDVVSDERFTLFTDALARLSDIEASEEQRITNEAERILAEENRKIEEAKRVEAELIRQHEEADRTKYDAIRESNENIRKQNESIRLANEANRIDEEAKRVEEENKRKLAEEERKANYDFMTEDEERRRSEANAHKEAENLRVQAETNRVDEEAKRRTTEQARVSAENTRVSNENTRETNELARKSNETQRIEAETQRKNRYNSFIVDAEANANEFENYTNTAKVKEEERKSNELDRKSQEDRRVSNEVERISNENSRKANEVVREENETFRQNIFENKVSEVNEKIVELNTTKDNFVSSINTKVDNKISELDNAKSDMTNTVSNKVNEVETRFNALTSKQQQDAEVIDARDGETSLKARLDRDIEKAKQVYVNVEGSNISTDSSVGYLKDVEILGNTIQSASNLADIRSVGDKVEGQELYEIPVLSANARIQKMDGTNPVKNTLLDIPYGSYVYELDENFNIISNHSGDKLLFLNSNFEQIDYFTMTKNPRPFNFTYQKESTYIKYNFNNNVKYIAVIDELDLGYKFIEDKLTILSPTPLEKVGDVADRIIEKDGVWGVEKNVKTEIIDGSKGIFKTLSKGGTDTDFYMWSYIADVLPSSPLLCDLLPNKSVWISDIEGIYVHNEVNNDNIRFRFAKSRGIEFSNQGIVDFFISNNMVIKYPTTQPQFIPLPHSQQIKLRTFAGQTNIHFETEIEGTIKAQVPKSLGATVNTHTEQINNLNKELDRVKKLEESTVSTVITESDFTTVEATSNGYFEDVKLEGKTLVNLFNNSCTVVNASNSDEISISEDTITITNPTGYKFARVILDRNLELEKKYTFIFNAKIDSTQNLILLIESADGTKGNCEPYKIVNGLNVVSLSPRDEQSNKFRFAYISANSSTQVEVSKNILILEGDHTQNPPSYFEGLKSVGQSATTSEDGVDEIVVSSVKGDGNLFDKDNVNKLSKMWFPKDGVIQKDVYESIYWIRIEPSTTYTIQKMPSYRGRCGFSKNKPALGVQVRAVASLDVTFPMKVTSMSDENYLLISGYCGENYDKNLTEEELLSSIQITKGSTPKPYTPHIRDKKRLLYYNNETQSWEKPILRQWDSIEKHADGKYYYHQRSGEVVLNGSENILMYNSESTTINGFYLRLDDIKDSPATVNNCVCDKFNLLKEDKFFGKIPSTSNDIGIYCGSKYIKLGVDKTMFSTLESFKQWLQTNNVTVVYQLAQEKVYECTNIDLITYNGETNYVVESGAIIPRTTLKVHNNISNVVSLLQKKVSLLESNVTSYMITQNRLMLASRYNADTVSFKVDVATLRNSFEYDNDLYELILNNILAGKDNYNREYIENLIIFYWMDFTISDEMYSTLFEIIEEQHNPKIEAPIE